MSDKKTEVTPEEALVAAKDLREQLVAKFSAPSGRKPVFVVFMQDGVGAMHCFSNLPEQEIFPLSRWFISQTEGTAPDYVEVEKKPTVN